MTGYGNRTAPDYTAESMTDQHESTRLGLHTSHDPYSNAHPTYGSGATGGAGFGNKSDVSGPPASNDEFRFDLHKNTQPYSNPGRAGSGSTGGAGYGNKTGEYGTGDSTLGKIMEKAGHVTHNENLVAKGTAKRETAMGVEKEKDEPPFAN
ncbi:hypothetical protein EK21DRAFT_102454 [Setomelanomma holmii]|uniref:Uncharacterized protein n=1 Tax=Setomelanomma holmii TaxID=210430 RepID=A0A9P4H618_9PLEO|nr:hypothetical protein EK21DRAFT_102454 [Setomelanomma holmii]